MALETRLQPSSTRYISYEEYLQDEGENHHTEWVNGKVIDISMVSDEHSLLNGFLYLLLQMWASAHQAGEVRTDPFNMKTGPNLPGRAPDVMFIANAHRDRLLRNHLRGPCDIAVEVVSPDYRYRDVTEKFSEYEQGGIPEYWVVDYDVRQARFYGLNENGAYEELPVSSEGVFHSRVLPGLWININWLWQRPVPSWLDLAREWNL